MKTKFLNKFSISISIAIIIALLIVPLSVLADNLIPDGDNTTPVVTNPLHFGTVCVNSTTTKNVLLAISRNGNYSNGQVFEKSTKATISALATSSRLSVQMISSEITIPDNWDTLANNSLTDAVSSSVTFIAGNTPGSFSEDITYRAKGTQTNNSTLQRDGLLQVDATISNTGDCAPKPSDTTPPVISYVLYPASPDGSNNWYKSNVTLTWTVTESESPSSLVKTGCVDQNITADQVETTYSCSAKSDGGTAQQVDVKIKRDSTLPTIEDKGPTASPYGSNGWYVSAVTNKFQASDYLSGFAGETNPYDFTKSSGIEEGSSVKINSGTVTDVAGNTAAAIDSGAFKIDLSDPTNIAFVGGPADGGSYYFGSVPVAPTCTAEDAVSGLAGCEVTGYGTAVGSYILTATATDNAGRIATATRSYTVLAWALSGFYQPVDMTPTGAATVWNTVKNGSTVPLKFEVFAGPIGVNELTDTTVVSALAKQVICNGGTEDTVEVTATGSTSLRYDITAGQFIYNWQTPKLSGKCYSVTMTTQDGSSLKAYFKLK